MNILKVKKFAPLMIALAIFTMGSVFAAWSYAGSNAGSSASGELQFGMEGFTQTTSTGVITVTANITSGQKIFTIDQNDVGNSDYKAKLVVNPTATITITFKPNVGVNNDIAENGITAECFFTFKKNTTPQPYIMDDYGNYDPTGTNQVQIINLSSERISIVAPAAENSQAALTKNWVRTGSVEAGDLTFTCTLNAADIEQHVQLNNDATPGQKGFILDSYDEYLAFGDCLDKGYTCALVVTDTTPVTQQTTP